MHPQQSILSSAESHLSPVSAKRQFNSLKPARKETFYLNPLKTDPESKEIRKNLFTFQCCRQYVGDYPMILVRVCEIR